MLVTEVGILRLYFGLDLFKGLTQVGKQIFNVLGTDGKTDGRLCDALFCQFLVVELGVCRTGRWMTNDLTSATLASRENISRWSMKRCASVRLPWISNVKMEPAPLGKYF